MNRECLQVEDEIWESVHSGQQLSESARHHLDTCRECAGALRQVEQIYGAMESAKLAPWAPDCRSEVLARIAYRKAVPVWKWAGACAIAVTAVVLGWSMLWSPHPEPGQRIARQISPKHVNPKTPVVKLAVPQHSDATDVASANTEHSRNRTITEKSQPAKHVTKRYHNPELKKLEPVRQIDENKMLAAKQDTVPLAPAVVKDDGASNANRPVSIAIVKWPSQLNDNNESVDYSYTQQNTETGDTTTCIARRSGDSVEIYMETREEDKGPKTIKGSVDDEANRNA